MAPKNRLGEMLLKAGVLNPATLTAANERHAQWGGRFTRVLADLKTVSEDDVTRALSAGLNVKRVDLQGIKIDKAALARLDVGFAEQHGVLPLALKESGRTLQLAMADPSDLATLDAAAVKAKARLLPVLVGETALARAISLHYRGVELKEEPSPELLETLPERGDGLDAGALELDGSEDRDALRGSGEAPAPPRSWDPARLEQLLENQRKAAAVRRAVTELLEEKGLFARR